MKLYSKFLILLVLILGLFIKCEDDNNFAYNNSNKDNIFYNDVFMQSIVENRQSQNIDELILLLGNNNPQYRYLIIFSLASIADTSVVMSIAPYLNDADPKVRIAAAYSLGVLNSKKSELKLIEAYNLEESNEVKAEIIMAIGKCGSEKASNFVASLNINYDNFQLLKSQGIAFYYIAKNNIISKLMLEKTFDILQNKKINFETKLEYSYFLTLDNNINISKYFSIISSEIEKNKNIFYTANLVTSLKHIKSDEALIFLKNILNSKSDYRIKIAAINAMYSYDYNTVRTFIFDALNSDNFNVAIKSSEFIFDKGNSSDAAKYFEISKKLNFRQARINLLRASLKYSVNKSSIISSIISGYKASEDAYEKADFLYCLAIDPSQYQFVSEETFKTDNKIISTSGIQTLVEMRLRPDFDKIASDLKELKGEDLNLEFKAIFNEAATSDDNALIYYAALIMNKIGISYFNEFINTFFLTKALNLLVLPRDIKTYNELCKTNELANGTTCVNNWKYEPYEIDWSKISIIKGNQLVRVKTTKGDFEIMLDVNSAPASVNAFVSLVEQNYYNNTFFYINSPARAIVTSGKRGDGWLNVNIPLVCELNNLKFQEGSVAMNLLSDKFQSVNFFIATSPIIEYNDKYTVFGQVVKGMDVIHTIEVGDKILSINILD